jgi:hypothetical protein
MSFSFSAPFQVLFKQLQNYSTVFAKCSFYVCIILLAGITYKDLENREAKKHTEQLFLIMVVCILMSCAYSIAPKDRY